MQNEWSNEGEDCDLYLFYLLWPLDSSEPFCSFNLFAFLIFYSPDFYPVPLFAWSCSAQIFVSQNCRLLPFQIASNAHPVVFASASTAELLSCCQILVSGLIKYTVKKEYIFEKVDTVDKAARPEKKIHSRGEIRWKKWYNQKKRHG